MPVPKRKIGQKDGWQKDKGRGTASDVFRVAELLRLAHSEIEASDREKPMCVCRWSTADENVVDVRQYGVSVAYFVEAC